MTDCKTFNSPMDNKLNAKIGQNVTNQVPFELLIGMFTLGAASFVTAGGVLYILYNTFYISVVG